tara:strand:+ start:253 stop:669 length:417 start_codon:yes stop_codon:yes gene_type:complete
MNYKWLFSLFFIFVVGCTSGEKLDAAKTIVDEFYSQYSSGDFDGIIEISHEQFFEETTEEEYKEILISLDERLGKVEDYSSESYTIKEYAGSGDVVELEYSVNRTLYESVESFVIFEDENTGEFLIVSYHVSSKGLLK